MDLGKVRLYGFLITASDNIIIIILEWILPYNKGQRFFREGFFNDFILYNFLQSFVLGIIISYLIEFIDNNTGLSKLRLLASWPVWLQLAFLRIKKRKNTGLEI